MLNATVEHLELLVDDAGGHVRGSLCEAGDQDAVVPSEPKLEPHLVQEMGHGRQPAQRVGHVTQHDGQSPHQSVKLARLHLPQNVLRTLRERRASMAQNKHFLCLDQMLGSELKSLILFGRLLGQIQGTGGGLLTQREFRPPSALPQSKVFLFYQLGT